MNMIGSIQDQYEDVWKRAWASLYGLRDLENITGGHVQGQDLTGGQLPKQEVFPAVPDIRRLEGTGIVEPGRQGTRMPGVIVGASGEEKAKEIPGDSDTVKKPGRASSPKECKTCKERKYKDGSDENVSFKSAQHVSPESAGARVRAHEGEHVSNAYAKAQESGGKVVQASVSIHTAICPECGRTYVSGGTTNTKISYPNESNPYQKARKFQQGMGFRGENMDTAV